MAKLEQERINDNRGADGVCGGLFCRNEAPPLEAPTLDKDSRAESQESWEIRT